MGSLFSSPKMPAPAPVAPPPTREDPAIEEAKRKQRMIEGQRRGRAATIVTGGLGDTGEAEIKRPTLG